MTIIIGGLNVRDFIQKLPYAKFTPYQNFILQHMVCNFIIALLHILTFVERSAWSSFVLFAASILPGC